MEMVEEEWIAHKAEIYFSPGNELSTSQPER
jgi:hypothetical protein